jgi:hypothetical protein
MRSQRPRIRSGTLIPSGFSMATQSSATTSSKTASASSSGVAEAGLHNEGSFKAAEARYTDVSQINVKDLKRWLKKAEEIQWDYKNIVKRKGVLEKITPRMPL